MQIMRIVTIPKDPLLVYCFQHCSEFKYRGKIPPNFLNILNRHREQQVQVQVHLLKLIQNYNIQ